MKVLAVWTLIATGLITTNVWAQEDESFSSYESIINELRDSANAPEPSSDLENGLDWDEIALHGGLSAAFSYISAESPSGRLGTGLLKGFEGHFGMNLFSRVSRAEMVYRNFSPEVLSRETTLTMNEFEARIVFLPVLRDRVLLRMGAGLSARQTEATFRDGAQTSRITQAHGASSLLLGFERKLAREVSLGPDFSYRSPMTNDSIEKSSWDASFRLNATF